MYCIIFFKNKATHNLFSFKKKKKLGGGGAFGWGWGMGDGGIVDFGTFAVAQPSTTHLGRNLLPKGQELMYETIQIANKCRCLRGGGKGRLLGALRGEGKHIGSDRTYLLGYFGRFASLGTTTTRSIGLLQIFLFVHLAYCSLSLSLSFSKHQGFVWKRLGAGRREVKEKQQSGVMMMMMMNTYSCRCHRDPFSVFVG